MGFRTDSICVFDGKNFNRQLELQGAKATFNAAVGPRADEVNITLTGFYNHRSWYKSAEIVLE